ncbi:hypothetical protein LX36DRAFT_433586 [Colletotrichum falcatum]|nr:hypothetical protein LX36DRAFT_433586 [Colletotrichum falcatum]
MGLQAFSLPFSSSFFSASCCAFMYLLFVLHATLPLSWIERRWSSAVAKLFGIVSLGATATCCNIVYMSLVGGRRNPRLLLLSREACWDSLILCLK